MIDHYGIVQDLTLQSLPRPDQARRLNDFAFELGWRPSDQLELPDADSFASAHLIVEHGLQNTAVISFLRQPRRFPDLNFTDQKILLNASYNNLVDWHIGIDYDGVSFVYNRYKPPQFHVIRNSISRANVSTLSSASFEKLAGEHPSPNIPALDDALIKTISVWKRQLAAVLPGISNSHLSALFNAIIFARAAEDQNRKRLKPEGGTAPRARTLLELLHPAGDLTIGKLLTNAFERLAGRALPASVLDLPALSRFDSLDEITIRELLNDFYRNKYERYYEYDFSLMSKHALSRIYEHYVSILRVQDGPQASLFPTLPEERMERSYGNVYTPEFIARFFAKYLRKELPLGLFQKIRVADPACGSGLFLRTVLELQHEALFDGGTTDAIYRMFSNVLGIDVDPNACYASRLSLALLALVLVERIPDDIHVVNEEAIEYFIGHPGLRGAFDAVMANPPFVTTEQQSPELKSRIIQILGGAAHGRADLYLAILKVGLDMLKPGGFGLFVLPTNVLISNNASGLRRMLAEQSWIHCVADLSGVRVFGDLGVYVILLVFQKRADSSEGPNAIVVRCQDLVGQALQDVLEGRACESAFYNIYEAPQSEFRSSEWLLLPPQAASIRRKFESLVELETLAELRQGAISGADDVFIVPKERVPRGEGEIFAPFLSDREMAPYNTPKKWSRCFFYPFAGQNLLREDVIREQFPKTWSYLVEHRQTLQGRSGTKTKGIPWWRPSWPRVPKNMLRPKIVTPHLVITPRFSLDGDGIYVVSHAPVLFARAKGGAEHDHLCYLLAVLNSTACFWQISQRSHGYERGYSRLEMSTLAGTRIPGPSDIDAGALRRVVRLVQERMEAKGQAAFTLEEEIDDVVADLYELTPSERRAIGMRGF